MGPVLNGLITLQSIENRLRAVKAKLARCRRSVVFQENQVRNLQNALEAKLEEIKLMRVQADRRELDLKARDEQVAKYRAALNMAKSNKEYSAILTELNTSKADNAKIENEILDMMKIIEADEAECVTIKEQIEEQKTRLEQHRKDTAEVAAKYEAEIGQIQAEWDEAATKIPPEALQMFERVADTYDGEALATVEQPDERLEQYSCGGCFMGLTTETVNQLMTRDEVQRCPNCSRILVLKTTED